MFCYTWYKELRIFGCVVRVGCRGGGCLEGSGGREGFPLFFGISRCECVVLVNGARNFRSLGVFRYG